MPLSAPFARQTAEGRRVRVLDVVPFEEADESPFVGLLEVEAALDAHPSPGQRFG
jgi:hypothetical protein